MNSKKAISALNPEKIVQTTDMFVVATTDGYDKKITAQDLFRAMHHPKTVAQAKAGEYVQGEVVTIIDYQAATLAHGLFMAFCHTQKPDWFSGDIVNALYEVNGSAGKVLLMNLGLTSSSGLVLTLAQAKQLSHLLNNTGKLFYEPMKKLWCVMRDNTVQSISLQPVSTTENTS